jgi:hypothetical protein
LGYFGEAMNELDFIEALTDETPSGSDARELLGKLKTAGVREIAQSALGMAKQYAPEIAAGTAGAGLLTAGQYLSNRGRNGKKSPEQRAATVFATSAEAMKDQAERDNRPLNFREDLTAAVAPASKNIADVLARHPMKGALLVAPVGAYAGLRILKALK